MHVDSVRKSLGTENTYARDLHGLEPMAAELRRHGRRGGRVAAAQRGLLARTTTIKVRYDDFTTVTRAHTGAWPSQDAAEEIAAAALRLLQRTEADHRPVRLLGVTASNLRRGELPTAGAVLSAVASNVTDSRPVSRLWDKGEPLAAGDRPLHRRPRSRARPAGWCPTTRWRASPTRRCWRRSACCRPRSWPAIRRELAAVVEEARDGGFVILPEEEDGHTALENRLTERLGEAGRRSTPGGAATTR